MKKFFEAVKDFIYDSVDYLIMITIIAIVVVVIGWRINILFKDRSIEENQITIDEREENNESAEKDNTDSAETESTDPLNTGEIVEVVIPPGSLPSKIGEILVEKNLVETSEEFISKSQEMNLDTKFKSGNYDIENGTSLENIIKILTN